MDAMAPALAIIVLLLTAAPAAYADTQAISSVQSAQTAQRSQIFGLPPLPVMLGAAGAVLERVHSPVRLNTRVVVDQPEQQQLSYGYTDQTAFDGHADVPDAFQQQQQQQGVQYVSSDQPTSQPAAASDPTAAAAAGPSVSGYWIQNPDGTRTPLADDDPLLTKLPGASVTSVAAGQVAAGTVIAGDKFPVTTGPRQQGSSWVVDSQNFTTTDGTTISTSDISADSTASGTVISQGPATAAMPIYHPQQQQQQQVWVPVAQGPHMMQGYYPIKSKGGMVVVSQPGMAAGYGTVGGTVGWAKNPPQGMAWGATGMGQGNLGQNQMQGNVGLGQMQGSMGQSMGQGQMQDSMGQGQMQGNVGQGQMQGNVGQGMGQGMGVPANSGSDGFADDSMSNQQQQQQQGASASQPPIMGPSAGFNRQTPAVMEEEPPVGMLDQTQQGSSGSSSSSNIVPAQGMQPQPNPAADMGGPGPKPSGPGPRNMPGPGFSAGGAGGPLNRRPPAMIPVNPQQGGTGDSMAVPGN